MRLVVAALLALTIAAPAAAKAPRLSAADRASINRTLDVFVNHGVKRVDVGAAYDVVAPELRTGISRKAWARGDLPIYPYPAKGRTFHGWTIEYVTREEVAVQLMLFPTAHNKVDPTIFHVYLRPVRGRWLVDQFMPAATLAPLGAKPKVLAASDFAPKARGDGDSVQAPAKVNDIYLVVPFATMAAVILGLCIWGMVSYIRGRRLVGRGRRREALPPLRGGSAHDGRASRATP